MRRILFVCEHNSARSQIAEAYMNLLSPGKLQAESAGLEPGVLNETVVEVLREDGIDISAKQTRSVFDLYKRGNQYDAVITVCSPKVGERCPLFPGRVLRLNWPFSDPAGIEGTAAEKLEKTREIRDQIKQKVIAFIEEHNNKGVKLFVETSK